MLPPEIQRIVLLIALAATGYLMILAWNDDVQESKQPLKYSDAPLTSAVADPLVTLPGNALTNDVPKNLTPASKASSDIPQVTALGENSVSSSTQSYGEIKQLVSVTTPSLKVWIDLTGGDIVRVQLPKFPVDLEHPDLPYQLLDHSSTQTYIAQSGLIGRDGVDSGDGRAQYTTAQSDVVVAAGEERIVVLTTEAGGVIVNKSFVFRAEEYLVDVIYEMDNRSSESKQAAMFAQIKRDTKAPANEDTFALAPRPYLGGALTTDEDRYKKVDFDDIDDDGPLDESVEGGWIAFLQHYFLAAWIAPVDELNSYTVRKSNDGTYIFGFTTPVKEIAAGTVGHWQTQFYAGPKDQKRLEEIAPNLNLTVDYGFLWWVAIPLFYLLDFIYEFVGNWGLAIILLTVVVKTLLFPLSAAGYRSMANMRRVAPAMKRLQERYSNDREKLSKEMMALYKKEGANPLGGCLPMILPMPIFIALYWVLFESVELRQAPFFFWIQDLAVMDPFFILPLLMGASMYWMQTLNPQVGDPMQVKMMKMMPIMFTVLFLFFPAGLVLYWLVNNLLGIAQQQYVYKKAEKVHAAKS